MTTLDAYDIICDLGGTNVRFATVSGAGEITGLEVFRTAAHAGFPEALSHYLKHYLPAWARTGRPERLTIGAAGPIDGDWVRLTNAPWVVAADDVRGMTATGDVRLYNDLQAVARAIPDLVPSDLSIIRPGAATGQGAGTTQSLARAPALALNVGTGFGLAALHRLEAGSASGWLATSTEAGHMTGFGSASGDSAGRPELEHDDETLEDFMSGDGLVRFAKRCSQADRGPQFACASDVFANAGEPLCQRIIDRFGCWLGRATRDLILAHGAWSGVYLTGSVALGWLEAGRRAAFDQGFAGPAAMADRLAAVPVFAIRHPAPGLVGLAAFAREPGHPGRLGHHGAAGA